MSPFSFLISYKKWQRTVGAIALFFSVVILCLGCSARTGKLDPTDWNLGKSYGQMKDEFYDRSLKKTNEGGKESKGGKSASSEPPIPEMSAILAAPRPPEVGAEKLVSLSLTEEVPLKDVFVELGRLSDLDMEIDPGIRGGVILRVKDKPFSEVVNRIAELAGLRVRQEKGTLRIERDLPYLVNYQADFLNMTRIGSGSVSMSTQVLSSGGSGGGSGGGGGGLTTGSNNSLSSSSSGDLWKTIETGIRDVLTFDPTKQYSTDGDIKAQGAEDNKKSGQALSINQQTGVISVLANERQHKNVKAFIDRVRLSASAQVLIEAKVVEVELNEEYRTGIDWSTALVDKRAGVTVTGLKYSGIASGTTGTVINLLNKTESLKSSVSMLETFGSTHTLSSPRLNAMNNQQAVLTFAENKIYFKLKLQEQQTQGSGTSPNTNLTIDSTASTVPVGVMLTLQPSINLETSEITMNIRPTLSRVTTTVEDPGVSINAARSIASTTDADTKKALANIKSEVPVIKVREMDSVLKIKSGQIMVIGGLMEDATTSTDNGVPFLGRVPLIGNAFKGTARTGAITETVIFIKATIIPPQGVSEADKSFYQNFTRDPRPVAF